MHERSGDDELARRLEAYAAARLSPSAESTARMRARVMREARFQAMGAGVSVPDVQAASAVATTTAHPVEPAAGRVTFLKRGAVRRVGALLLAATLVLGSVASVSAGSRAGGPLYGVRLWLEEVTLPADPAARLAAEIARLDARIEEARAAAAEGNSNGVAAALAAYRAILIVTLTVPGADRDAALEAALGRHLVVLEAVAERLPTAAQQGIQNAIEHSSKVVNQLKSNNGKGNPGNSNGEPPAKEPGGPARTPERPNLTDPQGEETEKPGRTPPPRETKPPKAEPTPTEEPEPVEPTEPDPTPKPGPPSERPARNNEAGRPNR